MIGAGIFVMCFSSRDAVLGRVTTSRIRVGQALDKLPAVIFLHVYLAFPEGRLQSRFERVLVGTGYVAAVGLQLVKMGLGGVGPQNLLEVSTRARCAHRRAGSASRDQRVDAWPASASWRLGGGRLAGRCGGPWPY